MLINKREAALVLLAYSNIILVTIGLTQHDRDLITRIFESYPELKEEFKDVAIYLGI
jgi:hypothetical protein